MYTAIECDSQETGLSTGPSAVPPRRGIAPAAPSQEPSDILLRLLARTADVRMTLAEMLADSQLLPRHQAAVIGRNIQEVGRWLELLWPALAEELTAALERGED